MSSDRHRRVSELFVQAEALPASERRAFLMKSCAGDAGLRDEVEDLLENDKEDSFLLTPDRAPQMAERFTTLYEHLQAREGVLPPGQRLGGYVIEEFLARGGVGEVYRATETSASGRVVALKVLNTRGLPEREKARFQREAKIASTTHHPHLVDVYDFGMEEENDRLYYAMRLVEGPTLHSVLKTLHQEGQPPASSVRRALVERCCEVAEALAALHSQGLVHRDVKPANILLEGSKDGDPWRHGAVLVDYGLVRPIDAEQTRSARWATLSYAAPEYLLRESVDARADVYSLGLCLHDLCAARLPIQRSEDRSEPLEPLSELVPGIDPDLEAIVACACDLLPVYRYPDAACLAQDLRAWLDGKNVTAHRLQGLERLRRFARRHPRQVLRWTLGVCVGMALVLVLALGVDRNRAVLAASRDARASWERADLAGMQRALQQVPALLDGVLLSGLDEVLACLRDVEGDRPLALVARTDLASGPGEARLMAARFLERDGLSRHPDLAEYLRAALDEIGVLGAKQQAELIRLLARLFLERPVRDPDEARLAGPFRERLLELLHADLPGQGELYLLTALAGCGTPEQLPAIAAWLEVQGQDASPHDAEALRLGVLCQASIVRRSADCGMLGVLCESFLPGLLPSLVQVIAQMPGTAKPGESPQPLMDLRIARALALRAASRSDAEEVELPTSEEQELLLGAARGDPAVTDLLQDDPSRVVPGDTNPFFASERLGWVVGLLGEVMPRERQPDLLKELRAVRGGDRRALQVRFDRGLDLGQAERRGLRPAWEPDLDTHLGAFFGERSKAPLLPPLEPTPTLERWHLARFDFGSQSILFGGAEGQVTLRGSPHLPDEYVAGAAFARLGIAGFSEVVMEFAGRPGERRALTRPLELRLLVQKANRPMLPYGGTAALDVLWDGTLAASGIQLSHPSAQEIVLPLQNAGEQAQSRHQVVVRLHRTSGTTLRLLRATIGTVR